MRDAGGTTSTVCRLYVKLNYFRVADHPTTASSVIFLQYLSDPGGDTQKKQERAGGPLLS